jgi:hypothetical protein
MFKSVFAVSFIAIAAVFGGTAGDARADHRWRFENDFPFDGFQVVRRQRFDDFENDVDADVDDADLDDDIVVPRRKRNGYVYDPETDSFIYKPQVKRAQRKIVRKPVVQRARVQNAGVPRKLSSDDKRRISAITGKTQAKPVVSKPLANASVAPLRVKQVVAKPVIAKPVVVKSVAAVEPKDVLPTAPKTSAKTQPRLVLPPDAATPLSQAAPKSARLTPISPAEPGISCDKAQGIVSGYGFQSVSPQVCVGKTYSFRATRDGKSFEIRMSSASGELTEVRKL